MEFKFGIRLFHNQSQVRCSYFKVKGRNCRIASKTFLIGVEVFSMTLNPEGIVIDFGLCKKEIKQIIQEFEGKVIISRKQMTLDEDDESLVKVQVGNNCYFMLPRKDCIALKSSNTSLENICSAFSARILSSIKLGERLIDVIGVRVTLKDNIHKVETEHLLE